MFSNPLTVLPSKGYSYAYRYLLTTCLLIFLGNTPLFAQPTNDSCFVAREVIVPNQVGITLQYTGTNVGATPELPSYYDDCSAGGLFSGFGADVWYQFTPTNNICVFIEVSGLAEPEFNVIENSNCTQGLDIVCASSTNGSVTEYVELSSDVTYYLRVSGASYSDQGEFTLSFTSEFCGLGETPNGASCLVQDRITFDPLPNQPGNTYDPGQRVNICYTIEQWTPVATNWIHSVEIIPGSGWDYNSLMYELPESCDGQGYWEWYDFWQSCNTGQSFGPGFAYESPAGIDCGGSPFDGNPGNNWGDGLLNFCEPVPPIPRQFCWSMEVLSCDEGDASSDLSIEITVYGDGNSGSWDFPSCDDQEPDEEVSLTSSADCSEECEVWIALVEKNNISCPGEMDGFVNVFGFFPQIERYNISVYSLNDELLFYYPEVALPFTSPTELDTGYYGILVEAPSAQALGFCNNGVINIIHIDDPFEVLPRVIANCNTDSIQLRGATWPPLTDATYNWNGPNGFTSSEQDPFVYESGTYYFDVRQNGCRINDTLDVLFRDSLPLAIDYLFGPPCADNPLLLVATGAPASTGNPNYQWLDANTGAVLSPNHFPSQNLWDFGIVNADLPLRLVGYDEQGCSDTLDFTTTYVPTPPLVYELSIGDCTDNTAQVSFPGDDILVLWSDMDAPQNPRSFGNLEPGEVNAIPVLVTYNDLACSYLDTISLVGPGLQVTSLDTIVCPGDTALISASPAENYLWSTGAITATIQALANPGNTATYSVTATDFYGCERTASIEILSTNLALAEFTASGDALTYQFQPLAPENDDSDYLWEFGDGTISDEYAPQHTFPTTGTYDVVLTVSTRCGLDTYSQTIGTILAPVADFTANNTSGCSPLTITFFNQSTNATAFAWTFAGGEPATSTQANPTVTYSTPGAYAVQLTAINESGESVSLVEDYVTVLPGPSGSFSATTDLLSVQFNSATSDTDTFVWNFGDGNSSTDPNPMHSYEIGGTYTVTLSIINGCGTEIITQEIIVSRPIPDVGFSTENVTEGCAPLTITYINESENATSYQWTFPGGNPSSSTAVNPTVTYTTPGIYNAQLNATNEAGTNSLVVQTYVTVLGPPTGGFTYVTNALEVQFTSDDNQVDTYAWSFGDGTTSDLTNPLHVYTETGIYTVTLVVTNECGSTTIQQEVSLNANAVPNVAFTTEGNQEGCAPYTVQFVNQSTGADAYQWVFPGGEPGNSTETNPTVTYDIPGTYLVQLTATNENGDSLLTQLDYIEILPLPSGTFTTETDMLTVTFTPEGQNVTSYFWDFGDTTTSDEMSPVHTYTEPGEYLVVLTFENECGSATISETITVIITGLANLDEATHWSLYPNPTRGNLWLNIVDWPQYTQGQLTIFNALGKNQGIHPLTLAAGDSRMPIQLTLPAGIYWVRLEAAGFAGGMKKIVVQ